jgi:hypothetical protein
VTYTAHDPRLLYDAIVSRLGTSTGRPIGDAGEPSDTSTPYAIVYPLIDEPHDGPLDDPTQVVDDAFQVTCVGVSRQQAQWMQKQVRDALLGWTPTVSGFGTFPVQLLSGSGTSRDTEVSPPLHFTSDRFTARLSG